MCFYIERNWLWYEQDCVLMVIGHCADDSSADGHCAHGHCDDDHCADGRCV